MRGTLLRCVGEDRILWGTDSIWYGSPQSLIDAFRAFTIPERMQEEFGYPPLTEKVKRRIFGLNAAKLYRVKPNEKRCTLDTDRLDQMQIAQGGPRPGRTLRWYGPQTRRGFLALQRLDALVKGG